MADEGKPPVWGLWNESLGEWFNPGTSKPYFPTREAAHRLLPVVLRQYPFGKWEIREYPLEEVTPESSPSGQPPPEPERPAGG